MSFQSAVEEFQKFLRWIAELIVTKNWFALLVLSAVLIYVLFTPPELNFFSLIGDSQPSGLLSGLFKPLEGFPAWYVLGFVLLELGLIIGALIIAIRSLPAPQQNTLADIAERKAIKGLRPFSAEDAEIFAKLQRTQSLRDCLESLTNSTFRFGILMGESGCGKTSFLQAGIWPQLINESANVMGIYVRFSDRDPMRTIAQALAEQLALPLEDLIASESAHTLRQAENALSPAPADRLMQIFSTAVDQTTKPLVLLFDQFEQFFVHYKLPEQRQPFVDGLTQWYRSDEPLPVKILVSIRSDLVYQLDDLHQALGYALGPQEVFQLKKFIPEEAAAVLEVIAGAEELTFDRRFVVDLADQELANREDGRISPVDLQILAWMIERQTATDLRAFNREAFQKFGGVEGLLQRFLEQTLQARVTKAQRESAIKVLLALTDLDRQVRAGVLTVTALESELKGTVSAGDVKEAVSWLARGDVRLITPQEQEREIGYELAHERLIPALMQQAGKELSAADKANQLLDRRVNEWLGNGRQSRYWFGPLELWQIERQLPYLIWGPKKRQKEQLLRLSQRRNYGVASAIAVVIIAFSGFMGWWLYTPWGQLQRVRVQTFGLLDNATTFREAHVALAYAKHNDWAQAQKILQKHVAREDLNLSWFIREVAKFTIFHIDPAHSTLSQQILPLAELIEDEVYKSSALRAIATAYGELGDASAAQPVLTQALTVAEQIESEGAKSSALRAIATAYGELGDASAAQPVLTQALTVAEQIEDDWSKSSALR
ncbi:MAG: tetratricopeptide repeat protein, partial [Cyanobacteria bacterium P01_F01_bin.56]